MPFVGGWIGYISYEAGRFLEPMANLHPRPTSIPMMQWSLFDSALIHDATADRWFVAGVELPELFTWEELSKLRWGPAAGSIENGLVVDRLDRNRMMAALPAVPI